MSLSRRDFLTLMSAAATLAALPTCSPVPAFRAVKPSETPTPPASKPSETRERDCRWGEPRG
jgi:hypothetical protein